jgi:fructose-bisphosphate aldolase, class I
MKKININKILRKGKAFILAYDQGMEHGPADFTDDNIDPLTIISLANKLKVTGLAVQKGIAEKYRKEIKVPLIVKLNGKTNLVQGEPMSEQLCSVAEAIKLKAAAVGYTIYLGSQHENQMMQEFAKIEEEAHAKGLPVILWAYPRGKSIENRDVNELMAYATRAALELGADLVKINYTGDIKALTWAVKAAGRTKVIVAGGPKIQMNELSQRTKDIMKAKAAGIAIGRNVWQDAKPTDIGKKLQKIVLS